MSTTRLKLDYLDNQTTRDYYKSFALLPSAGKAVICLKDSIVLYDEGGTRETLPVAPVDSSKGGKAVNFYNNYTWRPNSENPHKGWMRLHNTIFYAPNIRNQDIQSWRAFPSVGVNRIVASDNSALALAKHGLRGSWLKVDGTIKPVDFESNPLISGKVITSFIIIDDILHIGFRDGTGAAEINLLNGVVEVKSEGLNLTNANGSNTNGSDCQLAYDSSTNTLYAQTQQGQFKRNLDENKWQEINPAHYGGRVDVVAPGEISLIAQHGTWLYNADIFYPQTALSAGYTRAVVRVGNELISYVRHGGRGDHFTPYFLSTSIQSTPRKEVTKVQELAIKQPQNTIRVGYKLYVASKGSGLVEISDEGVKTLISEPTLAVTTKSSNELIVVTEKELLSYSLDTDKITKLNTFPKQLKTAKVKSKGQYTVVIENPKENGNQFVVYDSKNKEVYRWGESATYLFDAEIDGSEIYVAGFVQRRNSEVMAYGKLAKNVPVQVPFLKVYDASKNFAVVRSCWNFDPNTLDANMADSRLYRITLVEEDGRKQIVVLGESHGGNTVFEWNGKDLNTRTMSKGTDWYGHAVQTGDTPATYVGILDAATLTVIRGQLTLARDGKMNGATLTSGDGCLCVGEDTIYVGGMAAYKIQGRDSRKVLGEYLPEYGTVPGDASLLTLSKDLDGSRKDWQAIAPAEKVLYFDGEVALVEYKGQLRKIDF